ncbi:MAG TPA: oligosaccharide flippase family protein [Candidatus Saccharimonadales bacterium]|nr:oligosaccharide flippase family protein [Candidatus Saccharimonadales bacterium]
MRTPLRSLTRDTFIYGLGQTVGRVVTRVGLVPVFTRVFVTAQFGALELVTTLSAALQVLFISGLDTALNRYVYEQETPEDRRRLVSTALAWRLGLSLLLCVPAALAARGLAARLYGDTTLQPYLRVALLSVPCTLTVMFVSDYLRMSFRPWAYLGFTVLNSLGYALLAVYLVALRRHGVSGALGAQLAADLVFALIGLALVRGSLTLRLSGAKLRELLQVGLPIVPMALSYWVIQYADRNFLVRFRGYHEVGVYGAAAKVALFMTFATQAFTLAWGPFGFAQAREEGGRRLFARVLGLYVWVGAALAVLLSMFAREILGLGTTRAYAWGHPVASLLVFASLLNGTYYIFAVGITMAKRTALLAVVLVSTAALTLFLDFSWARPFGMYGVGSATLTGYTATTVLLAWVSQRQFPCPYPFARAALLLLFAAAVAAVGVHLPAWSLGARLAAKAGLWGAYLAGSLLFGLVSWDELRSAGARVAAQLRPAGPAGA